MIILKDGCFHVAMFFCVPSTDESFDIVYIEAMSFGKPIVAFDIYPINEIVVNGECGILAPVDNTDGPPWRPGKNINK